MIVLIVPVSSFAFRVWDVELIHISPLRELVGSDVTIGTLNLWAVSNLRRRVRMSSNISLRLGGKFR